MTEQQLAERLNFHMNSVYPQTDFKVLDKQPLEWCVQHIKNGWIITVEVIEENGKVRYVSEMD